MAVVPTLILLGFVSKAVDLGTLQVPNNLSDHRSSGNIRGADRDPTIAGDKHHLIEHDLVTFGRRKLVHCDDFILRDPILPTACLYYGVHFRTPIG